MQNDTSDLDELRSAYKAAVEAWIAAIKQEEALASVDWRKSISGSRLTFARMKSAAR
jgi:hypothetical protein